MRRTALRGHALRSEGKPYRPGDPHHGEECSWYRVATTASFPHIGVALCECGETSPELTSDGARKRWHSDVHKPEVRAQLF